LRIALIGQAAFAEKALYTLHQHNHEIVHVFAPPDNASGRADPLKTAAIRMGLPLSQPKSFKSEAALEHFRSLAADLAVLAFATIIVPERILYLPRFRSICFHPSLLPRHRGASAINWAIIQGDKETGVTWFWPDAGIDTGPILIQRRVAISPTDSVGSLYFDRLFPLGIETLIEAVGLISAGDPPAIPQDESLATYEPPCRSEHARIDFAEPARKVFDLVRGCDPQPGAHALLGGTRFTFYDAILEAANPTEPPGTIVSLDNSAMRIALDGGMLRIGRIRVAQRPAKVDPFECRADGLSVGARFE
jgi:methionyl-tRNA formyltransferase